VKPGGSTFTSRANTTTPTADPDLQVSAAANRIYKIDCNVLYTGGASNSTKFKFTLAGPSGSELDWYIPAYADAAASTSGWVFNATSYFATTYTVDTFGTASTSAVGLAIYGTAYIAGTAGTVSFNWAQGISSATTCRVWSGSHLVLTPIG
jgi:hypothetical protein